MYRFRWIAMVGVGVMLTGLCLGAMAWQGPAVVGVDDATLAGITGGAGGGDPECYRADTRDDVCEGSAPCTQDGDKWRKEVSTGQPESYCRDAAVGEAGARECEANTEKTCFTQYTCTAAGCPPEKCTTNTTTVNTNCSVGGGTCVGGECS